MSSPIKPYHNARYDFFYYFTPDILVGFNYIYRILVGWNLQTFSIDLPDHCPLLCVYLVFLLLWWNVYGMSGVYMYSRPQRVLNINLPLVGSAFPLGDSLVVQLLHLRFLRVSIIENSELLRIVCIS